MTCTSGEPIAETPKLYAVGLTKDLVQWVGRDSADPAWRWSNKTLIPRQEVKEWLDQRSSAWEAYVQRTKKHAEGGRARYLYRLAIRSYDRHLLALLALHWRIPVNLISSTWKSSSKGQGELVPNRPYAKKSKNGSTPVESYIPLTLDRHGRPMPAQSPL